MEIRLIAIGNKMPHWINEGFNEYAKRLVSPLKLVLIEIPAEKRSKQSHLTAIQHIESDKMLQQIKPLHRVIALDLKGKSWSTVQLVEQLKRWQVEARSLDLLIGGPEGLSAACLNQAELHWSLSPLTLPHPLVRVVIAEQIYRAQSIILGHPYHR